MNQKRPVRMAQVSPSMIQSVFRELKSNGYSDGQIVALSEGLMELANPQISRPPAGSWMAHGHFELGGLEELEALCSAGLPHPS